MTTDDFPTAARAEAERRFPIDPTDIRSVALHGRARADFTDGAEWARDHLAAQEPTDADPTPLQERIERILAERPIQPPTYAGDAPIAVKRKRTAARIAEEVAAEVRKAQADALREAARYFAGGLHCADMRSTPEETVQYLTRRATDIEQED